MTLTLLQKIAASALVETIERQCRDEIHGEQEEMRLRRIVAQAISAFEMPLPCHRSANDSSFDETLAQMEEALNPTRPIVRRSSEVCLRDREIEVNHE